MSKTHYNRLSQKWSRPDGLEETRTIYKDRFIGFDYSVTESTAVVISK
jgi:hypothetical protein